MVNGKIKLNKTSKITIEQYCSNLDIYDVDSL